MDPVEQAEPVESSGGTSTAHPTAASAMGEAASTHAVAVVEPPELLQEETFESLQSEVDSEEMHDAETGSSPERVVVTVGEERVDAEEVPEVEHPPLQVLMEQGEEGAVGSPRFDPLLIIEPLLEDDEMHEDNGVPALEVQEIAVEQPDEPLQAAAVAVGDEVVRMEDDFEDADDDTTSSSDISLPEPGGDPPRRTFYLPVSRVNEAIRRLIARDNTSGATLADLLEQDTFMQRFRRLLFSLDHDRRRNRRRNRGNGEGEAEEGGANGNAGGAGDVADAAGVREGSSSHSVDGDDALADADADVPGDEPSVVRRMAEEEEAENSIRFDTNLAAEHSYLGANMNRVSGVNYLEEGHHYNLMLFMHQHILFPGEVLPFMISETIIEADIDAQNGLLFGVCFPFFSSGGNSGAGANGEASGSSEKDDNIYGVTCQIYEKGTDARGNTLIKSRALQRFVTKKSGFKSTPQYITAHPQLKSYSLVKILPEIFLREPLKCIDMGAMNRFRDISSMQHSYKRFQAASTPWPTHVYDYYSITAIVEKARTQLAQHKIDTMPTDPVQLSFWLVRNLHLSESMMKNIFMTDSVNKRMKMIAGTFTQDAMFTCRYCGNRIANCRELFAMSKHGVQTQYCNSAGYIHETNTVYQLLRDAVLYSGEPSTEFSWFPGYQWHIVVCRICSRHIGWEFKALEANLVPKLFFGISSSSVRISTHAANPRDVIFHNFMRLLQREMQ